MNGIEKITERIAQDASAEIQAVEAEAKAKCDEIAASSDKAAQEEYWKLVQQGTKDAENRLERLGSVAALEAKKKILAEKQALISETFDRAIELLLALPADEYTALLARLAADSASSGTEEIILSPADKEKYGAAVCQKANELLKARGKDASFVLADETRNIRGGLIAKEGNIEVNCSFEVLVGSYKSELSSSVAEILFDERRKRQD